MHLNFRRAFNRAGGAAVGASVLAMALVQDGGAQDGALVHHIVIESFAFLPASVTVKVGERVEWTNNDVVPHTATAMDKSWDTGQISNGESRVVVATAAGAIEYFCVFHPHMKGEIVSVAAPGHADAPGR